MTDWQMKIIAAEAERLIELAAEDADLRADLRLLAQRILAATLEPQTDHEATPTNSSSPAEPTSTGQESVPHEAARGDPPRPDEPLRRLTLGRSSPTENEVTYRS